MNTDIIIALLSLFLFGWSCYRSGVNQGSGYYDEYIDKWYVQLMIRSFCFFIEAPIQLIIAIIKLIKLPFLGMSAYFQLQFYFAYIFNRKKFILTTKQLEGMNRISIEKRNTKKLNDIIFRHATGLVNKLNGFNPELIKEEKEKL